jgi:hypothetical protein
MGLCVCGSSLPSFAIGPYQIGSGNTVTADPTVAHPQTTPCVVQLFSNVAFDNFTPFSFPYAPPTNCPGPWQKVVFEANLSVTAGNQFDRTANFWLGGPTFISAPRRSPGRPWARTGKWKVI